MWSDVFQAVVMIMGLLAIIILPLILSNNQASSFILSRCIFCKSINTGTLYW